MTFDPETLYAKPKPGRGIRPAVFVAGGLGLAGIVLGIVTRPYWWPDIPSQTGQEQEIRSSNSNTPAPPLNFQAHYAPAVYPPPAGKPEAGKEPGTIPSPHLAPTPRTAGSYGPPNKKGVPEEERMSSVITGTTQVDVSAQSGSQQRGYQQVADNRSGRQGFYGAAGASSDAFRPTGIVGQLGRCAVRPGSYLWISAEGVISSATPGQVTARTTRPIYAGPRGDCYASPAGATLVGAYNADTAYGDERLQVAWTALILPNGRMIDLGGMPGAGGDGAAGLPADVNNHIGALAGAVLAGTAVDVVRGLGSFGGGGNGSDVVINMGGALADRSASVAERLVDRELNRKPTLTAAPEELTVQVTRPIELDPYKE